MTPYANSVIRCVARIHGIDPDDITRRCRVQKVFRARVVVAKLLDRRGYSSPQIGRALNCDPTTIIFYLGRGKKKPSAPRPPKPPKTKAKPYWHRPRIAHLKCKGCRLCVRQLKHRSRFLVPYAGADMTEYQWTLRPTEERRP